MIYMTNKNFISFAKTVRPKNVFFLVFLTELEQFPAVCSISRELETLLLTKESLIQAILNSTLSAGTVCTLEYPVINN